MHSHLDPKTGLESCRQNTHSHDTFVLVQVIRTLPAQMFHSPRVTTRTRVAQGPTRLRIAHCGVSSKIPSSQRHVLYVAALVIDHFYTISYTYLTYLPTFFSLTVRSSGNGSRNPNVHLPQVVSPRWSNRASSSLELSLTRIMGQIRIKYRKEFWEITNQILSQKIRRKLDNLVSTCPTSNQGYTPITI